MSIEPATAPGVSRVPGPGPSGRVRLAGPGALVACLPELVGFTPEESLVVVGLRPTPSGRHEIGMTMRVDLAAVQAALEHRVAEEDVLCELECDDPDDESLAARLDDLRFERMSLSSHPCAMARVLVRNRCPRAVIVAVSDAATPPDSRHEPDDVADAVTSTYLALSAFGIEVADSLLLGGGRWWSYQCLDPGCCPPEGTPLRQSDADLLRAELAWAGEQPKGVRARAEIVEAVAPRDDAEAWAVRDAVEALDAVVDRAAAVAHAADLLQRLGGSGAQEITPDDWARLLRDLQDVVVRDACLATWKGTPGGHALELWCAAARLAPPGHVAPPATMAAVVAHARGHGALAGEAVERAQADDPGYRMAGYAAQLLAAGIPPTEVRRTIVGATATLRARGQPVLDPRGRLVSDRPTRRRPGRS